MYIDWQIYLFQNIAGNDQSSNDVVVPNISSMPIENNDESGSDDDAILDQCRKIAWPEKTTSKVAPFR